MACLPIACFLRSHAGLAGGGLQHHLGLLAARLVQDLGERRIAGQVDGERAQRLLDGRLAVVVDGADVPAPLVFQDHALQEVVDVLHRKRQVDAGVALDLAFALEIADAAGKEHDLGDGQRRGGRLSRDQLLVPLSGRARRQTHTDNGCQSQCAGGNGNESATHERSSLNGCGLGR
jgi:hypothetical protein